MGNEDFFFHLLQKSIIQLLKSHGFQTSTTRPIDVLTSLTARYISLLIETTLKYTHLRNDTNPTIQDLSNAFLELKIISPAKRVDKLDLASETDQGIANLKRWVKSSSVKRAMKVSKPIKENLEERREQRRKRLGVQYKMQDLAKVLDQQALEAQKDNPTLPFAATPTAAPFSSLTTSSLPVEETPKPSEIVEDPLDEDWIKLLLRDQITDYLMTEKLGLPKAEHQVKPSAFKGTVLASCVPDDLKHHLGEAKPNTDFFIKGPLPEHLMRAFPYYKSDDESDDDSNTESINDKNDITSNHNDDNNDSNMLKNKINANDPVANSHKDNILDEEKSRLDELSQFDFFEHHSLGEPEPEGDNNLSLFG
ncbi:Taf3 protein [Martiniozyma asiatica (nom. inval.)]|nr:Taf3 protein [Martiniozyma asiatica]